MDQFTFLSRVLPSEGIYFVDIPRPDGRGFAHHVCNSIADLAQRIQFYESGEQTVYYAVASYREPFVWRPSKDDPSKQIKRYRIQDNVLAVKSFWLDLDVGTPKPGGAPKYASQTEALQSTVKFTTAAKLPQPIVVSSGSGIHLYWPTTRELKPEEWTRISRKLKLVCAAIGFYADPARTSDSASVLRPPGTTNRKGGGAAPVYVVGAGDGDVVPKDFERQLDEVMKNYGVKEVSEKTALAKMNEQFAITSAMPPADAMCIADKCGQIRAMRDSRGDISEPHWYAAIQVLQHTVSGRDFIHQWSSGHPGYSPGETDRKIDQVSSFGPALCETFAGRNAAGCDGCPYRGKISSPILLGANVKPAAAPIVPVAPGEIEVAPLPDTPRGFIRGDGTSPGLYAMVDDIPIRFYDYDLYPTAAIYDEHVGSETVNVRHYLPQEGWLEFQFAAAAISEPTAFNKAMRENHVQPYLAGKTADMMRFYMDSYLRSLKESSRIQRLCSSFGWKDNRNAFVFGSRLYSATGEQHAAGTSSKIGTAMADTFGARGDFATWRALTEPLGQPGLEPHAFAFLTAFGGPLMELAGYAGLLVAVRGQTNTGKTTIAKLMSSVYGTPDCNWISAKATEFAIYNKLGSLNNLTGYVDETTNMDPKLMSELVYNIANGTTRERLKSDATPHEKMTWKTILMMTLNDNVHDMLERHKRNAEPEKVRVLQYELGSSPVFKDLATNIARTTREHYGHAGPAYAKYIVQNWQTIKLDIENMMAVLERESKVSGIERFMIAGAACTLVGGYHAYRQGLIAFEPVSALLRWTADTIAANRTSIATEGVDSVSALSEFLDDTMACRLVVTKRIGGIADGLELLKPPIGSLTQRVEIHTRRLWISRQVFKAYCAKQRIDFDRVTGQLKDIGVIVNMDIKKVLGGGIAAYAAGQVRTIEIDLGRPELAKILEVPGEPA